MGKSFSSEIQALGDTYNWALDQNLDKFSRGIKNSCHLPLISVGSGGSYSSAELHATLHRTFFHSTSQAVTPTGLTLSLPSNGRAAVWFLSASGNNIDIRRAFQHAALLEPRVVCGIVGRKSSKLKQLSEKYQFTDCFEYLLRSGKDGFLATNSLLGFSILIYRAYCAATGKRESLPPTIDALLNGAIKGENSLSKIEQSLHELTKQKTLHVLYSPKFACAAIDIESKYIEAGLGSVHIADIRNFAHGRHHWFDKNPLDCGVLCITDSDDEDLALRTLNLLPQDIPSKNLCFVQDNGTELLSGILFSLYLTNWRGLYVGIDPGRPGVPDYGSKIYRLTAKSGFVSSVTKSNAAVRRKCVTGVGSDASRLRWGAAYKNQLSKLSKASFGGVVFDYDGTLIADCDRGSPPSEELCSELIRLLESGIVIGMATGRGKSIRKELQQDNAIPREFWDRVIIGYYNGADIAYLCDCSSPDSENKVTGELVEVKKLLAMNPTISELNPTITYRKNQITIESNAITAETFLWDTVQDQLSCFPKINVSVTRSSHSVDILNPHICKSAVIDAVVSKLEKGRSVLTIGDRGRWPGNDFALLNNDYSLSVDEISSREDRCWNLSRAGIRGPQATMEYLKRITCSKGVFGFKG